MIISILVGLLLSDTTVSAPLVGTAFDQQESEVVVSQLPIAQDRVISYTPQKLFFDGKQSMGVEVSAQSAVVIDVETGRVLFKKNSDYKGPVASMTKLMSALVFLDFSPNLDRVIELEESDERAGAQPHVYRGERVTARNLLYASLMSSDNNSTIALARTTGLQLDEFIDEMNKKALQLGLYDTTFSDPTGLDEGNISTAFDMSRLIHHALQYDIISEITSKQKHVISIEEEDDKKRTLYNTDRLLDSYINTSYSIKGGKTGFIPESGYCLGIEVENSDKHSVVVVAMGSQTNADRFKDVKALTQWTFDNFEWVQ